MHRTLQTNIYALYLIKLSKWFMLIMPIVALYYAENGLSNFDIYLLQAVYSLSVAILEIPSGFMADTIGRRKSLIIGSFLGTLGFVIYTVSTGFYGFMLAEVTLGLGGSFISGSDSAMLYDSLAGMRKQHKYLYMEGRITSLGSFAETVAAICGGVVAVVLGYRFVYFFQAAIAALAIPASLLLLEPERRRLGRCPAYAHIFFVCRESLLVNKKLSATLLLSSIVGTSTLCMAWTSQVYFVNKGLTEATITPLWVSLNFTVAVVAAFAARLVARLGRKRAIIIVVFMLPSSYIFLGTLSLIPALIILLVFYAVRGFATPLLKELTNIYCDSGIRATVFSLRNMIIRVGFTLIGPFIGCISGVYSHSIALQLSGCILLALSGAAAFYFFNVVGDDLHKTPSSS